MSLFRDPPGCRMLDVTRLDPGRLSSSLKVGVITPVARPAAHPVPLSIADTGEDLPIRR